MAAIKTHKINGVKVLVQRIPGWGGWYAWANHCRYVDLTGDGRTEEEALEAISTKIVKRQESEAK